MENGRKSGVRHSSESADRRTKSGGYNIGAIRSQSQRRNGTRQQSSGYSDNGAVRQRKNESMYGNRQTSGMNRAVTRKVDSTGRISARDKSAAVGNSAATAHRKTMTEAERRKKMEQARKRERLRRQRIRAAVTFIFLVILIMILLFMTPIFAVRQIVLNGNSLVTKEQIEIQIKDFVGDNLFRLRTASVEKKMKEIPLVSSVLVEKKMLPPSIIINIAETKPAAYLLSGNNIVVVDSSLKVLGDSNSFDTNTIPSISGISVPSYELNNIIEVDSEEKANILRDMLDVFAATGLTEHIKYISVDDLSDIKFNYDNRIEAVCGSQLELERKIRMFAEAVKTDTIGSDAMGTMDLSILGQATFNRNLY